jgi:hypothetical protein
MKEGSPGEPLTRARVLELLEAGEFGGANAVAAATDARLAKGDEYIDLEDLQAGVQRASGSPSPLRHVLPRKTIHEDTWRRILRQLKATPG